MNHSIIPKVNNGFVIFRLLFYIGRLQANSDVGKQPNFSPRAQIDVNCVHINENLRFTNCI